MASDGPVPKAGAANTTKAAVVAKPSRTFNDLTIEAPRCVTPPQVRRRSILYHRDNQRPNVQFFRRNELNRRV